MWQKALAEVRYTGTSLCSLGGQDDARRQATVANGAQPGYRADDDVTIGGRSGWSIPAVLLEREHGVGLSTSHHRRHSRRHRARLRLLPNQLVLSRRPRRVRLPNQKRAL